MGPARVRGCHGAAVTGAERRNGRRVALSCDATVFTGMGTLTCRAVDLAEKGIGLNSPHPQKPGQYLRINFTLDGRRWLDADGVVVRQATAGRQHRLGVRFEGLDPASAEALRCYIGHDRAAMEPAGSNQPDPPIPTTAAPRAAQMVEPPPPAKLRGTPRRSVPTTPRKPRPPADLLQRCLDMKKRR